jgi:hypothetical protein
MIRRHVGEQPLKVSKYTAFEAELFDINKKSQSETESVIIKDEEYWKAKYLILLDRMHMLSEKLNIIDKEDESK